MGEVSRIELLLEGERRGILSPENKALLDEARQRGLVPGTQEAASVTVAGPRGVARLSGSTDPFQDVRGMSVLEQIRAMFTGDVPEDRPPQTTFTEIFEAEGPQTLQEGFESLGMAGEIGATTGAELIGQRVGGALGAPFGPPGIALGTAGGGALGSGAGLVLSRKLQGRPGPTMTELGTEMGLSALPEFAEPAVKRMFRGMLRQSPAAQILRREEATRLARETPQRAFQPTTRAEAGALFDAVRDSGVQFDLGSVAAGLGDLTEGQVNDVLREVRRLDRQNLTGGRWEGTIRGILDESVGTHDIGDLQAMHSALRKRIEGMKTFEGQQLLQDLADDIDEAIFTAPTTPGGAEARAQLGEARRQWARIRGAEELGEFLEDSIGTTSDASRELLSFATLRNQLRRNRTPRAKAVNRALDATPGARPIFDEAMTEVQQFFQLIERPIGSDVTGLARSSIVGEMMRQLGDMMLRNPEEVPALMRRVTAVANRTLLDPTQPLAAGRAAAAFNALRRELSGGGETR